MADTYKKISDFSVAASFGDNDLLLVSQSGITKVVKGATLKALAKAAGVDAAKINGATVNATGHLVLTTTDGTAIDAGKVTGNDGVSITDAAIDAQYHLILTLSDGSTKDAGYCRGASGAGTGDMLASEYDSSGAVKSAGGIPAYINNNIPAASTTVRGGVKVKRITTSIAPDDWRSSFSGIYTASIDTGNVLASIPTITGYNAISTPLNKFGFTITSTGITVTFYGDKPTAEIIVTAVCFY